MTGQTYRVSASLSTLVLSVLLIGCSSESSEPKVRVCPSTCNIVDEGAAQNVVYQHTFDELVNAALGTWEGAFPGNTDFDPFNVKIVVVRTADTSLTPLRTVFDLVFTDESCSAEEQQAALLEDDGSCGGMGTFNEVSTSVTVQGITYESTALNLYGNSYRDYRYGTESLPQQGLLDFSGGGEVLALTTGKYLQTLNLLIDVNSQAIWLTFENVWSELAAIPTSHTL